MCLEGITEGETDTKGRLRPSFKVTPCHDRVLCIYALSGYSNRKQLARGRFFEGLQNYMENKTKGNENKIIYGDFNCAQNKKDEDGEIKVKILYWCCPNCVPSKFIVDNGL